jgi:hypothetical protein
VDPGLQRQVQHCLSGEILLTCAAQHFEYLAKRTCVLHHVRWSCRALQPIGCMNSCQYVVLCVTRWVGAVSAPGLLRLRGTCSSCTATHLPPHSVSCILRIETRSGDLNLFYAL